MPRPRNRLNVTLSADVMRALTELSQASGIAASSFVASVMNDSLPVIEAMTQAFTQAKKAPQKAAETMNEAMQKTVLESIQASLALTDKANAATLRKTTRKRRV
jgi:hypothetical protein